MISTYVMEFFSIKDYDFTPARTERANIIVINDRRIYANDYEVGDFEEIRVDGAVLTVRFNGGAIRSTNWTAIYDLEVDDDDKDYFKDFIRL